MKLLNKKNIKLRINKHQLVAFGYISAITLAFVLSTVRNNSVNASVSTDSIKNIEMVEEFSNEMTPFNGYKDEKLSYLDNVKSLFNKNEEKNAPIEISANPINSITTKEFEVAKGDNFIGILTNKVGISYNEATKAINAYKKIFDPRNLRIGQKIKVDIAIDNNDGNEFISLEKIVIEPNYGKKYILTKTIDSEYKTELQTEELIEEIVSATGTINGTLSSAMTKEGISSQISASFINIFSFTVDFRRDVRDGDKFEIVYENKVNSEGKVIKTGDILYASITLRNDKFSLYRFEDTNKNIDYYNEKGMALKRTLHRKPLAMQKARISSPFGKRRHPIYKDLRIHWGVDYAAPRGTAIFAAGDGVVQAAKYNGGYGNYVRIRHNSEYSTAYGHMHRFAAGIKPGIRVKQGQIIGYVGNTGNSTGPHLHYEVIANGKRVNPTTIKAATGENLTGRNLEKFKTITADIKNNHSSLFAEKEKKKKMAKK